MSMIALKNVSKFYYNKSTISSGFTKLNLSLDMGEFVVITGESGSGKSTLLNVISGLDSYEEGEMYINGEETSHYTEVDYENYRRKYIGNIFQHFNLVNSYTVYQNVELVLLLNGYKKSEAKSKVLDIIKTVGLTKYKNTKASKLSGGQKQRVAIARALAKDTPIIVADEPTGNLDVQSAKSIMKLLSDISKKKLVVIVTHNYEQVSEYATRKIAMNDGKIIEDKKLKHHEKCEAESVKYRDLTLDNKIRLGFRNAFNIKVKFALLFMVYFFLTLLVFSEYSGIEKQDFANSLEGYNNFFADSTPERIIISKKDKSTFSSDEIDALRNLDNVENVVQNDLLLDQEGVIVDNNYEIYLPVSYKSNSELSKVDEGRLPTTSNEVVIAAYRDSYMITFYKDDILKKDLTLTNNFNGNVIGKVKVVGIVYFEKELDENDFIERSQVYLSDELLKQVVASGYLSLNQVYWSIDDANNVIDNNYVYNSIVASKKVKEGEVYLTSTWNSRCSDYSCVGKSIKLDVSNIYYGDSIDLKVKESVNQNNFTELTGLTDFTNYDDAIFISEKDYARLFDKGDYQASVYLKDLKKDDIVLDKLHEMGYETYYLKETLVNPTAQVMGIIKVMRNVVFIIATVALFFICYFIIKIILKSRNVYYSTIRILGATKKISRQLLNIELFVDINVAYFAFLSLVGLTNWGIINWTYIRDLVTFFQFKDYVIIYVVLTIMSLMISNRYAHRLFKDSAMSTYREEV